MKIFPHQWTPMRTHQSLPQEGANGRKRKSRLRVLCLLYKYLSKLSQAATILRSADSLVNECQAKRSAGFSDSTRLGDSSTLR